MPGNCNSGNTSPSLISVLRQYRFQKKASSTSSFCSSTSTKHNSGQPKPDETTIKPEFVDPKRQKDSDYPEQLKPTESTVKADSLCVKTPKHKDYPGQSNSAESVDKPEVVKPVSPKTPPSVSEITFVPETPDSQRPDNKSSQLDTSQECLSSKPDNKSSQNSTSDETSSCLGNSASQPETPLERPSPMPSVESLTEKSQESPSSKPGYKFSQSDISHKTQTLLENGHCTPRLTSYQSSISKFRKTKFKQVHNDSHKKSQMKSSSSSSTELELSSSQHRQLMEEYDIFSEKERSLRNLLEMYPGSDIMEVQDILVSCDWQLREASQVLEERCVNSGKKQSMGQNIVAERKSQQKKGVVYDSDSTDSESFYPHKKKRQSEIRRKQQRIIISDDSDKEEVVEKSTDLERDNDKEVLHKCSERGATEKMQDSTEEKKCTIQGEDRKYSTDNKIIKSEVDSSSQLTSSEGDQPSIKLDNENYKIGIQSNNLTNVCSASESEKSSELSCPLSSTPSPLSYKSELDLSDKQICNKTVLNIRRTYSKNIAKRPKNVAEIMKESLAEIQKKAAALQAEKEKNLEIMKESLAQIQKKSALQTEKLKSLRESTHSLTETKLATIKRQSEKELSSRKKLPLKRDHAVDRNKDSVRSKKRRIIKVDLDDEDEEEEYRNECLYDSDASDDDDQLTPVRSAVMTFFQEATPEELLSIPGCSKKKAEIIIQCRPFKDWSNLVQKFDNSKYLSPELLNGAKKVLDMRAAIRKLMLRCKTIADNMQDLVSDLLEETEKDEEYVTVQPALLNTRLSLAPYQMIGLNWLVLMHKQHVNGILADEMGLGKTVQAISFLSHLAEKGNDDDPHLIVVPSSTLDNWKRELETWCPSLSVLCYHGSQEERRELRLRILNDEVDFDILITTYNMVTSCPEDRGLFKRIEFHYVIFDEAHMLKNMASQRYQNLMKIKAKRRLLLTGTPLQNNLVELMSLLIFVMPSMFSGKIDQVKQMFSSVNKAEENRNKFEQEQIEHAKHIMKPFVLRRLKKEVLKDLPTKHEETKLCPLPDSQQKMYSELVISLLKQVKENQEKDINTSGMGMMMQLRKAANHPLLLRNHYTDSKLKDMAELMLKEPTHHMADVNLVIEDMQVMSDFELHRLCKMYKSISPLQLDPSVISESAKFRILDKVLAEFKEKGDRILLFSQFTMMLDILEEYLTIRDYSYIRLDGTTPVTERQQLIDQYTEDAGILVFLLSTRAGGLGINLTAANTVIQHDIDFNPYNDKQAEDRCHRVGQKREVKVLKLISQNTIEENILQRAKEKLRLERDITAEEQASEEEDTGSVAKLLRTALAL